MSDALEENTRDKLYTCLSDTINGERDLVEDNNIFIYQRMDERGGLFRSKQRRQEEKNLAQEMRAYIVVSRVIYGETWLNYLMGLDVSYNSDTPFEKLDYGYTTECRLGMRFFTW